MAGRVCPHCRKEMLSAKGCDHAHFLYPDGAVLARHPVGSGGDFGVNDRGRCDDCGATEGEPHHPGCDTEKCPRCGGQALGCVCTGDHAPIPLKIPPPDAKRLATVPASNRAGKDDRAARWAIPGDRKPSVGVRAACKELSAEGYAIDPSDLKTLIATGNGPFTWANLFALMLVYNDPDPATFIKVA